MKIDIIIFGGQSNMCGQTEAAPTINPTIENAYEYRYETNSIRPLSHPVGEDLFYGKLEGSDQKRGSLVPSFCRAYTSECGRPVVAVHVACGATTITDWILGTSRHSFANRKIHAAIQKIKESYEIGRILYVWLQGESDALLQNTEKLYLERLIYHKNVLKEEVGIDAFGIIKVGYFATYADWVEGDPFEKKQWDEAIMRAQERAAAEDADFVMLTRLCPTLSKNPECINPEASGHYTNAALERIGDDAGRALARHTEHQEATI